MKTGSKGRRRSTLRRHRSVRRRPGKHVVAPAGAAEIRETLGVTRKDVDAARKILCDLGLDG
jgi:hypothetical protein